MSQPSRPLGRRLLTLTAVALVSLTGTACGSDEPSSPAAASSASVPTPGQTLAAATLRSGQPIPAPKAPAVLTLTGSISNKNAAKKLALDPALLDRLGVVRIETYDPWAKKRASFQGIWLADLLKVAGATPTASTVHTTALDDYVIDFTMAEVRAGGMFVATKNGDGSEIPVDKGGPARIVFLDDVAAGENPDRWIWSLSTIEVR
jgi:hypothetical protein